MQKDMKKDIMLYTK